MTTQRASHNLSEKVSEQDRRAPRRVTLRSPAHPLRAGTDGASTGAPRRLDEVSIALAVYAAVAVAIVATYSRLPSWRFYNVSGSGLNLGLGRMVVFLGYSTSLAAIALLTVSCDRLLAAATSTRQRLVIGAVGLLALTLCLTIAIPGVVDQTNLDVKLANLPAALGVALVVLLTLAARKLPTPSTSPRRRQTGDAWRVALVAILALVAIPYLLADVGIYTGDVPILRSLFLSRQPYPEPGHPLLVAVHLGHHEGMDGLLLVIVALLLSRVCPNLRSATLRRILGPYLSLLLIYGTWVEAGDAWHEQIIKRGLTHTPLPDVLHPSPSAAWAVLLTISAALYAAGFARRSRTADPHTSREARP
jgi:hypothetical protein